MQITPEEILHVAKLARLELKEQEVEHMANQLDEILSYVSKMNELDTEGVAASTHALSIQNAFREDSPHNSLPQEKALENGPLENGEAFVVPRVI